MNVCKQTFHISYVRISQKIKGVFMWNLQYIISIWRRRYWQVFKSALVYLEEKQKLRCTRGKTKIICSGGKFRHMLNSSEKVLYGGATKFSYTACQWIEAKTRKNSSQDVWTWWRKHGEGLVFRWQRLNNTCIFLGCWLWDWDQHSIPVSQMSLVWACMYKERYKKAKAKM